MKKQGIRMISGLAFCVLMTGISMSWAASPEDVPRITIEQLNDLMEDSEAALVVLDVRTGSSWANSDVMIETAVREDPGAFDSWGEKFPQEKTIVLYCT